MNKQLLPILVRPDSPVPLFNVQNSRIVLLSPIIKCDFSPSYFLSWGISPITQWEKILQFFPISVYSLIIVWESIVVLSPIITLSSIIQYGPIDTFLPIWAFLEIVQLYHFGLEQRGFGLRKHK